MLLIDFDRLLFALGIALLVQWGVGCTVLSDAHEKRQAVIHLIEAQARVVDSCQSWNRDLRGQSCGLETWPVTVSEKEGEPDTTLIRLPSLTGILLPGMGN